LSAMLAVIVVTAAALFAWLFWKERKRQAQIEARWEQEQRARDSARIAAIEEGLRDWLTMLKLPQLEEEKQLQAAARQLRIVLVERLMRGPSVD